MTNFGIQKFRLDYQGSRDLDPNNESIYTFKVPRHADLLMDAYFVFTIPDIWSTILPPSAVNDCWKPYQFKWIENLGTSMIKKFRILIGTQVIQTPSRWYFWVVFHFKLLKVLIWLK